MAQLMPLPLTVLASVKSRLVFIFLVPAHPGSPGQSAVKSVCVCVCACMRACVRVSFINHSCSKIDQFSSTMALKTETHSRYFMPYFQLYSHLFFNQFPADD